MDISRFGDFMLKSSELQRMVRNNALIRDKNPLWYRLESFELQFGKPSTFLLFTFPLCEEVRSHFSLCSLESCSDLFFYAHLGAIDLAPGNLAKVGYESGTQTDLHQGSESFPSVSVEELFLSVQTWMSDSLVTCFYRGFSVSRGVSGSHVVPDFLFGNHYQNQNCVWNHTASTYPVCDISEVLNVSRYWQKQ